MYCICDNPIIPMGMAVIQRGKDHASTQVRCPYCHRIYRIDLMVLVETDLSEETLKQNIQMRKGA